MGLVRLQVGTGVPAPDLSGRAGNTGPAFTDLFRAADIPAPAAGVLVRDGVRAPAVAESAAGGAGPAGTIETVLPGKAGIPASAAVARIPPGVGAGKSTAAGQTGAAVSCR